MANNIPSFAVTQEEYKKQEVPAFAKGPRYSIEGEGGWESIPEDAWATGRPSIETIDTETGKRVKGRKAFGQFVPDEMSLPQKTQPKESFVSNIIRSFGEGANRGIAGIAGIPGEVAAGITNLVTGQNQPAAFGTQAVKRGLDYLSGGVYEPQGLSGNVAAGIGEVVPNTLAFEAGPLANAAKVGNVGRTAARMAPAAVGSGTGMGVARTVAPGSFGAELAGAVLGGAAGAPGAVRSATGTVLGPLAEKLEGRHPKISSMLAEPEVRNQIFSDYTKAVRPSVGGKTGYNDWKDLKQKATGAIETIVNDSRERGVPAPTNMEEFSQAIDIAKNNIYSKYNAMTKEAGGLGATVDLAPLVNDLKKMSKHGVTRDFNKAAADRAAELAAILEKRGTYTLEETEQVIADLNSQLNGFYQGRTSGLTEKSAEMTDTVARYLRAALDDTINNFTGPGYQNLKNKYGQLRSIEKDVMNRLVVDARKSNVGLLDFSDMFSASKLAYSASKLDPAGAVAAGTVLAVKQGLKKAADPNRMIEKMFGKANKLWPQQPRFAGPAERELGFTMRPHEGEVVQPKELVPRGPVRDTSGPIIEGQYRDVTPLPYTQRAGLLTSPKAPGVVNAPWNPNLKPGGVADRRANIMQPRQSNIDVQAMAKKLYDMGYPPSEIQDMIQQAYEMAVKNGK